MPKKITSLFGGKLDINKLAQEYSGKKILNQAEKKIYNITSEGVFEDVWNPNIPNQDASFSAQYDPKTGSVNPTQRGSYASSEAYKYLLPEAHAQAQVDTGNFGLGSGFEFRSRGAGESQQAYLEARQAAGDTGITLPQDVVTAKYLGGGTNKAGEPIGEQIFTGPTKEDVERQASEAEINPANLFGDQFRKDPITVDEDPRSLAVDVSKAPTTQRAEKSAEMNVFLDRVKESFEKAGPTAPANEAFIQGTAQAAFGKAATREQLQMAGKPLSQILNAFGIADKMGDLAVSEATEGRRISDPEELQKFAKAGLTEADIIRDSESGIFIKPDSEFLKRVGVDGGIKEDVAKATVDVPAEPVKLQEQSKESALGKTQSLVETLAADRQAVRTTAEGEAGVEGIEGELTDAQKKSNELLAKIEQKRTDLEAGDILNEETKIALQNKINGQAIPMSTINKQILSEVGDLSQTQRLDRLYDVYELNSNINELNTQLRNQDLINGKYDRAIANVQANVDDFAAQKELELDILEQEGKIEKEERNRLQNEIDYERGLGEKGFVEITDDNTLNQIISDLNVTAQTYSSFFYKDPSNGRIYLRPIKNQDRQNIVDAFTNQVNSGTFKLVNVPAEYRGEVAVQLGNTKASTRVSDETQIDEPQISFEQFSQAVFEEQGFNFTPNLSAEEAAELRTSYDNFLADTEAVVDTETKITETETLDFDNL